MNKYIKHYLDVNRRRGLGYGIAINTYIHKYFRSMRASQIAYEALEGIDKEENVIRGSSIHGSIAYYPDDELTKTNAKVFKTLQRLSKKTFSSRRYFREI
jgi:hypothetical protein